MRGGIHILCIGSILLLLTLATTAEGQSVTTEMSQVDSIDIAVMYQTVYPGTDSAWIEVWIENHDYYVAGYQFLFTLSSDVIRFCETRAGYVSFVDSSANIQPHPGGYELLLKICIDACCIPDTSTERSAAFYLTPGGTSFVWDENGELIPFRYSQGEVLLWWSLPGDANSDSMVTVADVIFLTNYLYKDGSDPCMCEGADCNSDGIIDLGDMVHLINFLFKEGDSSLPGQVHCPPNGCRPE